jgi:aspartokinase
LSQRDIQVRLFEQGSSKISVLFLVHSEDFDRAVITIHDAID